MIANLILSVIALLAICDQPAAMSVLITAGAVLTFVALRVAIWGRPAWRGPLNLRHDRRGVMITPRGTVRRGSTHRR